MCVTTLHTSDVGLAWQKEWLCGVAQEGLHKAQKPSSLQSLRCFCCKSSKLSHDGVTSRTRAKRLNTVTAAFHSMSCAFSACALTQAFITASLRRYHAARCSFYSSSSGRAAGG